VELDLTGLQMPDLPEQPRQGRIVLRPLERGFGHTLGNTMRRILLSSLRGSAVWAFRADGVLHEHQTIAGVVEDVHQVIRNLKSLVLQIEADTEEAILELRADRAGRVTARNIRAHPAVQVMNPEHHILELQDDRELKIELYINTGRGFVLAEQHPIPRGLPADLVRIDSIYNPVVRANFVVEETRVGQRTDFDRLVLEVETNGAIDVPGAVQYAARLAAEHLSYLAGASIEWGAERSWGAVGFEDGADGAAAGAPVSPRIQEMLGQSLGEVGEISLRSRNSLQKQNIKTVADLVQRTEQEMLEIENFGKKSLQETVEFLSAHGLRFGLQFDRGEDGGLRWRTDASTDDGTDGAADAGDTGDGNGSNPEQR
jgi:DNA-directed RNA polymerase subunit alpha